jgi:hypothetical protein
MPVTISPNGEATSFAGEDGTSLFQAIALKSALKLHKVGIRINRHTRNKDLFYTAGKITGQTYKPKDFDRAIADLANWIEQAKAQTEII